MKVGLLICTFNRPEYLKQCLWSLERADLSMVNELMIVDDHSTNQETIQLIKSFNFKNSHQNLFISEENKGIKHSLLTGYEYLFQKNDIVINIDSDAIVRADFVERLIENKPLGDILTGFHCTTKNANGTERHKILEDVGHLYLKQSVGGINFCIDKVAYESFVKPALLKPGNWDHNACINAKGAYCLKESVIQHIGFDSSMNHNEAPDVADDFYYWNLSNVTLIGADSDFVRLRKAADICTKWIKFGHIKLFHANISSKTQYSEFCIREFYKWVSTSHMLICQHDGFVNNWQAWDNSWLQYDYIGAPWHYNDGMAVGNGGFSLRSKRLMEIVATDPNITILHPEDHHICRTYRPYLERQYGIKFAPVEVAEKFSFEGYLQPTKTLSDQFGVHGANPRKTPAPVIKTEQLIFNQFRGLGDILFLVPLCRALMQEGNSVLWPIVAEYMSIAKHFPDINFVPKEALNLPYESRGIFQTPRGKLLPYRFAMEIMGRSMRDCMRSKYEIYGHSIDMWRSLTFKRFDAKERELMKILNIDKPYQIVNRCFGEASRSMTITPQLNPDLQVIEMTTINGFSLIDWCSVIENASEIHTANTSLLYLLEILDLKMPIHFYKRGLWGEAAYEHTDYLYTKPYILH